MSFVNTLLQDITIFYGNDSSQLEDWFIDIKTASDLTSKSRTNLGQTKSKGLIHTLISEALNSNKAWDEIKDSPPFKNLSFGHSYLHQPFHVNLTKGKGIFSSIYTQI